MVGDFKRCTRRAHVKGNSSGRSFPLLNTVRERNTRPTARGRISRLVSSTPAINLPLNRKTPFRAISIGRRYVPVTHRNLSKRKE